MSEQALQPGSRSTDSSGDLEGPAVANGHAPAADPTLDPAADPGSDPALAPAGDPSVAPIPVPIDLPGTGADDRPDLFDDAVPPSPRRGIAGRIGSRIVRRPRNWLNSPWPTERIVQYLTALIVVGGCTFAVFQVVHLDLVFDEQHADGRRHGRARDGAGVPARPPAAQRAAERLEQLLVRRVPAVPLLHGDPGADDRGAQRLWIPYGVAFKIVAILGLVTLPFCCWAFGRLARFRYPIPELMALAALLFLFDESFTIYGGNVKSTMAGEFSFSIALSFAMLGLGLFARGLQTGKYRSWAAIVLALAMLSHGIVLIFVVVAAVLLWLVWMDKTRFFYGLTVLGGASLLSAFWVVPFLVDHALHDRHEVRLPARRRGRQVLGHVLPVPAVLRHRRQRLGDRRLRDQHRPQAAHRRVARDHCASR